jgi:RNA polymerase sigma factor (sigma-70 family)
MKENVKIEKFVVKYRERTIFFLRKHFTTLRSEDYEDIYQEASIVLFCKEAAGALQAVTCQLYTYFLRICINLSHKMVSRQQHMLLLSVSGEENVDTLLLMEKSVLEAQEACDARREKMALADRILAGLSEQSRRLLSGHYLEGKSWEEMASILGLSNADTAKSLACRYRRMLKKQYPAMA